jgi:hypothetical protein
MWSLRRSSGNRECKREERRAPGITTVTDVPEAASQLERRSALWRSALRGNGGTSRYAIADASIDAARGCAYLRFSLAAEQRFAIWWSALCGADRPGGDSVIDGSVDAPHRYTHLRCHPRREPWARAHHAGVWAARDLVVTSRLTAARRSYLVRAADDPRLSRAFQDR